MAIKATASESSHPHRGIDRNRPHIRPHQAGDGVIGNKAAITVKVARIVGAPTSSTARGITRSSDSPLKRMRRWMFSTTTIASSTRMPIEKIRANSETAVEGEADQPEANRVAPASPPLPPTTIASRRPRVKSIEQHHRKGGEKQLLDQGEGFIGGGGRSRG